MSIKEKIKATATKVIFRDKEDANAENGAQADDINSDTGDLGACEIVVRACADLLDTEFPQHIMIVRNPQGAMLVSSKNFSLFEALGAMDCAKADMLAKTHRSLNGHKENSMTRPVDVEKKRPVLAVDMPIPIGSFWVEKHPKEGREPRHVLILNVDEHYVTLKTISTGAVTRKLRRHKTKLNFIYLYSRENSIL